MKCTFCGEQMILQENEEMGATWECLNCKNTVEEHYLRNWKANESF